MRGDLTDDCHCPSRPVASCGILGRLFPALGLVALLTSPAVAGVADPTHRLERVGPAPADAVVILEAPGTGHALVLARSGDVLLLRGGGLAGQLVAHVAVDTSCPEHGVLDGAWDPTAPGRVLYLTYTPQTTRALTVGKLDVATGQLTRIYDAGAAAPCANVGGAIAFASDGTLLLGIGDLGQPSQADQVSPRNGKIYRMQPDGRVPAAPYAPNPLIPTSFFYAMGVRNPVRMETDATTGETWFLDQGPGDEDELNRVAPMADYGWDGAMQAGYLFTSGVEDPFFVWGPGEQAAGLVVYRGGNLQSVYAGKPLVATRGSGVVSSITPDELVRDQSVEEVLFTRDATGPQGFADLRAFPDGYLYALDPAGAVYRLLSARGPLTEPSSFDGMLPMTVRKSGAQVEVAVERSAGVESYGIHVGDVTTLATAGYSHEAQPPAVVPVDANRSDAYSRLLVAPDVLGAAGTSTYFLVSARRTCSVTGLGSGSFGVRPVGDSPCTVGVLGGGSHSVSDVVITEVEDISSGLALPRDLEFHPDAPNELWVVNQADYSAVIIFDPGQPTQVASKRRGSGGNHFFSQPSALAFGPGTGFFATSHEEDDYTQGPPPGGTPPDFMGPTLWIADSAVFEGGHATHYDMLHNSPNATGIAWERGNAYWVNDGYHASLTRYDFVADHGPGGADHSDAIVTRYAEGEIGYVADVVSHVVYDHDRDLVYAVDTGNNRVIALDPATGTNAGPTFPNYDGCVQTKVDGALTWTLIDGAAAGLVEPSGMEMHDGLLFVSDHATSRIAAFTVDGDLVDWLDTGFPPGTLMGMAFDPRDGSLYVVDTIQYRVLRIAAP